MNLDPDAWLVRSCERRFAWMSSQDWLNLQATISGLTAAIGLGTVIAMFLVSWDYGVVGVLLFSFNIFLQALDALRYAMSMQREWSSVLPRFVEEVDGKRRTEKFFRMAYTIMTAGGTLFSVSALVRGTVAPEMVAFVPFVVAMAWSWVAKMYAITIPPPAGPAEREQPDGASSPLES